MTFPVAPDTPWFGAKLCSEKHLLPRLLSPHGLPPQWQWRLKSGLEMCAVLTYRCSDRKAQRGAAVSPKPFWTHSSGPHLYLSPFSA